MNFILIDAVPAVRAPAVPAPRISAVLRSPRSNARNQDAADAGDQPTAVEKRRRDQRKPVNLAGHVDTSESRAVACTVRDMSASGAMLEIKGIQRAYGHSWQIPDRFRLVMETLVDRSIVECCVMWRRGDRLGVRFVSPLDTVVKKLAPRPPRMAAGRRR
jgi:hypothetical protein